MRYVLALVLLFAAAQAGAAIHTETLTYKLGETFLKGYLAYDDASKAQRPGVLVVHEWWGLNDYARHRAEMLAKEGYVAFAVDMYGDGKTTRDAKIAGEWSSAVGKDPAVRKARFQAAFDLLAKQPLVKPGEIAAIGYCFGGGTVLAMAKAGLPLKAVVSFHGSLPTDPVPPGTIKAKILACHGAADGFVPPEQVAAFQKSLADAGADWEFVSYAGAKHAFTNPEADKMGLDGIAYNAAADRRSWSLMRDFLAEAMPK